MDADEINYEHKEGLIHARVNVVFTSSDLEIRAHDLIIIPEEGIVKSGERVKIIVDDRKITGDYFKFNYNKGYGSIYSADSEIEDIRFSGGEIEISDRREDVLRAYEAVFTPCILDEPHYRFEADRIYVYPDERIVGKEVSFFWGDMPLVKLPGYVIHYREGKPDFIFPEIGYRSEDGPFFRMSYPYEITEYSGGELFIDTSLYGEQSYGFNNKTDITETLWWLTEVDYSREDIDDYIDYKGEVDIILNKMFGENLIIKGKVNYLNEREESVKNTEYNAGIGFDYFSGALYFSPILGYEFSEEELWGENSAAYNGKYFDVEVFQYFRGENLEKQEYSLLGERGRLEGNITYKAGYDTEYLPRLNLIYPFWGWRAEVEAASMREDELQAEKLGFDISYERRHSINHFSLDLKHRVHYNIYNNKPGDRYGYIQNEVGIDYENMFDESLKYNTGLNWKLTETRGDYLFSAEEMEEENVLSFSSGVKIPTATPESFLQIGSEAGFDFIDNDWESLKLEITRELDCYLFYLNYDFADNNIGAGIEF